MHLTPAEKQIITHADPLFRLGSPKRRMFCSEYVRLGNAKQAAINAGYSPKTASQQGPMLLKEPDIQEAIQALMAAQAIANSVTEGRVIAEIQLIAMDNTGNVATRDRLKALELLARYLGVFQDRVRIEMDDPDVIEVAQRLGIEPGDIVAEVPQLTGDS